MTAGAGPAPAPAVRLRQVGVRRGRHQVLHGIDADIPRGRTVGLLGPSGCGKSTLLRSIVGVQANVTGDVSVLGRPAGTPALRRQVGYLTQARSIYPDLTVVENLRYFARLHGLARRDLGREVDRLLEEVSLGPHRHDRVDRLSGGQQARVQLAAAFTGAPALLVLDEPTVGLDPVLREELWSTFHRLAAGGATLLVSSHVMDEAARCDRLLLLREGRVLADATPAELLGRTGAGDLDAAFLALVEQSR